MKFSKVLGREQYSRQCGYFNIQQRFAEMRDGGCQILLRYGQLYIFFVITDLLDNRVMFRETKASLCIDAILRSRPERIEKIVHKLG